MIAVFTSVAQGVQNHVPATPAIVQMAVKIRIGNHEIRTIRMGGTDRIVKILMRCAQIIPIGFWMVPQSFAVALPIPVRWIARIRTISALHTLPKKSEMNFAVL